MLRVALAHGTVNGHANDALQYFGDGTVGQLADVVSDDGVDDFVGVLFDFLGRLQRGALTGHDDDGWTGVLGHDGAASHHGDLGDAHGYRGFLKLVQVSLLLLVRLLLFF